MILLFLSTIALADPTLKPDGVYEGAEQRVAVTTKNTGAGTTHTTIATPAGADVATLMLMREGGGTSRARADFPTLGVYFEARFPVSKPDDVLLSWVKNGLVGPDGAHLDAVQKYCADRGLVLGNTAASIQRMQAAAAAAPPPPKPAASTSSASSPASSAPPAAPTSVSVSIHVDCDHKVRLFRGSSSGSGTYGWESTNTTTSYTMRPGDELCLCDDHDKRQSCWTAGTTRASLDVTCSGFKNR